MILSCLSLDLHWSGYILKVADKYWPKQGANMVLYIEIIGLLALLAIL